MHYNALQIAVGVLAASDVFLVLHLGLILRGEKNWAETPLGKSLTVSMPVGMQGDLPPPALRNY
jgi:hypothetical protein